MEGSSLPSARARGDGVDTGLVLGPPAPGAAAEALTALNALLGNDASAPAFSDAGGRPISVTLENIAAARATPYVVLEKTDGTHAALLLTRHVTQRDAPRAWCIARGGDTWSLPLLAPPALFNGSLFEGELLLLDGVPTLLLFKTLFFAGHDRRPARFLDRQQDAERAFGTLALRGVCVCATLRIAAKEAAPVGDAEHVYTAACVRGHCDGLVLVPDASAFDTGTRRHPELKWKPEHTIDLLFCMTRRADGRIGLAVCYSYGGGIVDACRMLHFGDGHAAFALDSDCVRLAAWRASVAPLIGAAPGDELKCVVECIVRVERLQQERARQLRDAEAAALARAGGALASRVPRDFKYLVTARMLHPRPDKQYPNTHTTITSTLLQSADITLCRLTELLQLR